MDSDQRARNLAGEPVNEAYAYLDELARIDFDRRPLRSRRHFNPSSISKCVRQLVYQAIGTPPELQDGSGWLSQYGPYGDFAHDQVRTVLKRAGVRLDGLGFNDDGTVTEFDKVHKDWEFNGVTIGIRGRGDGRIWLDSPVGPDGEELASGWYYLELKSVGAAKYRWMTDAYHKGKLYEYIDKKYKSFVDQSTMMASPEGLNLLGTYLLIVNRDNCQFGFADKNYENREGGLVIPFDPERWKQIQTKMAFVNERAQGGPLPMRPFNENSVDCKQCPYSERCWNVDD